MKFIFQTVTSIKTQPNKFANVLYNIRKSNKIHILSLWSHYVSMLLFSKAFCSYRTSFRQMYFADEHKSGISFSKGEENAINYEYEKTNTSFIAELLPNNSNEFSVS